MLTERETGEQTALKERETGEQTALMERETGEQTALTKRETSEQTALTGRETGGQTALVAVGGGKRAWRGRGRKTDTSLDGGNTARQGPAKQDKQVVSRKERRKIREGKVDDGSL